LKQNIASFIRTYIFPSETFIYEEIKSIKKFKVFILTSKLVNTHLFPYPDVICPWEKKTPFIARKIRERKFFYNILKEKKINLVHAWYAWSGIMILPVCKKTNLPLVTSFHGMDVSRLPRHFLYKKALLKLFKEGQLFLTRSFSMKEDVIKLGCPSEKIVVHYGGVDVKKFIPTKKKNSKKILMCGRMVEKKGFSYGILAFSKILKKHPDAKLIIIGDGKLRKNLEILVKKLKIEDKVKFLGFLSHERVKKIMQEVNIFLSPNVTAKNKDKEGIPNVIKEAMATGLPVLSTYHAGIPELVVNGKTGFLVEEKDVKAMADKLDYLLSSPDLQDKMGKEGRKIIEKKFNLVSQTEKLEEIYSELIR